MKKCLLGFLSLGVLTGCSTDPLSLQSPDDTFQKSNKETPAFVPLASGGVSLPKVDATYELPTLNLKKGEQVDIRPPATPLAIVKNSLTKFDGERALIVYTDQESTIYNLRQVERLFKEEGINTATKGAILTTDWIALDRADEKANTEIKYQVEQVAAKGASALTVSVLQMRRDGIIFTPSVADKQRYTSARLNRIISQLDSAYQKQWQDLSGASRK